MILDKYASQTAADVCLLQDLLISLKGSLQKTPTRSLDQQVQTNETKFCRRHGTLQEAGHDLDLTQKEK